MKSKPSIILTFAFIVLFLNNCTNTKKLDGWIGKYKYEEENIKANAGYNMVMDWELAIEKHENVFNGILEVNGQQTFIKLLTNISGDTNEISVIYEKLIDGSNVNLKKGDTLFILSKQSDKLVTKWRHLEPRLPEISPRECNCFIRD
ncbi:MAG: DUF5991 domain-containing protein [Chitinophagales bacterium]